MAGPGRRATFVGGLWNVAAMVVPLLSTVALSVVIARRLGPAELGAQSLVSYVGSLVSSLVIIGATNCTIQVMASAYGADDPGRLAALGRLSALVHVTGGVLAGLLLGGIGTTRDHALSWALIGVVTFLDALGWSYGSRLVAHHGWRVVSPLRLVSQIAASVLGIGAVLLGSGVAGVFGAQVLTSAWLTFCLRRRDLRDRPQHPVPAARVALRPLASLWGLFVLSAGLAQIVDRRVELIFLDAFGTAEDVAVYAVAFSLVTVAVTVPLSLSGAAMPGIAAAAGADSVAGLYGHLRRAGRLATLAGFLMSAALATVGPSLVLVFWGESLRGAASILPVMGLGVLLVPVPVLLKSFWTGVGRLGPVLLANGIGALADLGVAAALIPRLGVPGAVAANVSAQLVTCTVVVAYTRRHGASVGTSPGYLLRCAVVAALSGGAALVATAALTDVSRLLALIGGSLAFAAVLAGIGLVAGLVPAEDADWLAGTVPAAARPALAIFGGLRWARNRQKPPAPAAKAASAP